MSNTLKISLIVLVSILTAIALLLLGLYLGGVLAARSYAPAGWMMGYGDPRGYGMGGMMGSYDDGSEGAYGFGSGMIGPGMMGFAGTGELLGFEPLSLDEAEAAVDDYLDGLGGDNLALGEVMIFENHAYAQIVETDTGVGAMEVLVDPVTRAVYPEHGPNMMWNLKYSPMAEAGMMGMMSGAGYGGMMRVTPGETLTAEMPVTPDEAVQIAQRYLDAYLPGAEADEQADPFYGYYTLHILRDGETVGMLSVNGYTGQVFPHTWHAELVEMAEAH